ncbi:MAG: HAD family phosphatase [Bradyrhizobiaceae bacterium]|nr:HAD family phosphatase [Bradyrhizobiaceae bacterium]
MTVLLDVGNVLYHIDFDKVVDSLSNLPGYNGANILCSVDQLDPLFEDVDCGRITTSEFCQHLRNRFGFTTSDDVIIEAWNSILIEPFDFACTIPQRIRKVVAESHPDVDLRIALLSNISAPHLDKAVRTFPLMQDPHAYGVDATYYSFQLGMRKPDPALFLHVCRQEQAPPHNVVLFDDSAANVAAARGVGIHAIRVTPGDADFAFHSPLPMLSLSSS